MPCGRAHPATGVRRCGVLLRALTDRSGQVNAGALLCILDVTEEAHRPQVAGFADRR